jgi:hypothetical protein
VLADKSGEEEAIEIRRRGPISLLERAPLAAIFDRASTINTCVSYE